MLMLLSSFEVIDLPLPRRRYLRSRISTTYFVLLLVSGMASVADKISSFANLAIASYQRFEIVQVGLKTAPKSNSERPLGVKLMHYYY